MTEPLRETSIRPEIRTFIGKKSSRIVHILSLHQWNKTSIGIVSSLLVQCHAVFSFEKRSNPHVHRYYLTTKRFPIIRILSPIRCLQTSSSSRQVVIACSFESWQNRRNRILLACIQPSVFRWLCWSSFFRSLERLTRPYRPSKFANIASLDLIQTVAPMNSPGEERRLSSSFFHCSITLAFGGKHHCHWSVRSLNIWCSE